MQERITSQRKRDYLIQLHVPQGDPPRTGYPLVWLLDAPTTWAPMQQALRTLPDTLACSCGRRYRRTEGGLTREP